MDPLRGGVYAEIAISAILIIALPLLLAPVFSSFYLSNLAPIPRPLSFCRCNLSPLITRSRKFVHISVSQPPTPLLSFCTPRYSPLPLAHLPSVPLLLFSFSSRRLAALPLNFKEQVGRTPYIAERNASIFSRDLRDICICYYSKVNEIIKNYKVYHMQRQKKN